MPIAFENSSDNDVKKIYKEPEWTLAPRPKPIKDNMDIWYKVPPKITRRWWQFWKPKYWYEGNLTVAIVDVGRNFAWENQYSGVNFNAPLDEVANYASSTVEAKK